MLIIREKYADNWKFLFRIMMKKQERLIVNNRSEKLLRLYNYIGMTTSAASKIFNVPRSMILGKVNGKTPCNKKSGPLTILSKKQEDLVVKWVDMGKIGFPVTKKPIDWYLNVYQPAERRLPKMISAYGLEGYRHL